MNRISVLVVAGALGAVALTAGCSSSTSAKGAGSGGSTLGTTGTAGSTSASGSAGNPGGVGSTSGSTSSAASSSANGNSSSAASSSAPEAASSTTSSTTHAAGSMCTSIEMPHGTWTVIPGSEGAGHVAADIALQNTSSHTCTVAGFPGVSLLASNDHPLPTYVVKDNSVPITTITVAPGAWVHSEMRYSPDIAGPGEPQSGQCEPMTVHALAELPGDSAWTHITLDNPTPVCEKGELQTKPFVSGESSPAGG